MYSSPEDTPRKIKLNMQQPASDNSTTIMAKLRDIEARSVVLTEELHESRQKFDQVLAALKHEKRMRSLRADAERWLAAIAEADPSS